MVSKSKFIINTFETFPMDPMWSLASLLIENPLAWTIEVDGFLIDISQMPEKEQKKFVKQGLIPMTQKEFKKMVQKNFKNIESRWIKAFGQEEHKPEVVEKDTKGTIKFIKFVD